MVCEWCVSGVCECVYVSVYVIGMCRVKVCGYVSVCGMSE